MENRKRSEKLSDSIGKIDGKIINDALNAGNIEELKRLKAERSISAKTRPTVLWSRIALVAACFLLFVGITVTLPFLLPQNTPDNGKTPENTEQPYTSVQGSTESGKTPGKTEPPSSSLPGSTESGTVIIDGLSKLNYYSAKKLFADSNATVQSGNNSSYRTPVTALSVNSTPSIMLLSNTRLLSGGNKNIYYYDIKNEASFTVSGATFFQFVLDEKNEYLSSRLGTGLIDVVITDNSIDQMITFRNGDKYYSCLKTSASNRDDGTGCIVFSSHKYIDGFYIVKNFEQDNYAFQIETDGEGSVFSLSDGTSKVTALSFYPFNPSAEVEPLIYDIVENSCYSNQMSSSYSIDELESYFNQNNTETDLTKAVTEVASKTDYFDISLANGAYRINSPEEAEQYAPLLADIPLAEEMFDGSYYLLVYGICGDGNGYSSYTLGNNEIVVLAEEGKTDENHQRAFIVLFKVSEQYDNVSANIKWN